MFRSKEATLTDEDIDVLLAKGEAKTKEGLEKLKSLGDIESLQVRTQNMPLHNRINLPLYWRVVYAITRALQHDMASMPFLSRIYLSL